MQNGIDLCAPFVDGESKIFVITRWYFRAGNAVKLNQESAELELGNSLYMVNAPVSGTINVFVDAGRCVVSGQVIGQIVPF